MPEKKDNGDQLSKLLPESYFDDKLPELKKVLPASGVTAEAIARVVITAMNKTPDLRACTPASIGACLMDICSLGLMPNTPRGHAWLIPYRIDGKLTATLQIGYLGFCDLAYRTNQVKMIQADVVRDGDTFRYAKGVGDVRRFVEHIKAIGKGRKEKEVLAAWAAIELVNGGYSIEVADQDELFKIKAMAAARNREGKPSPAWKFFEDEMFKKTVLKRLLKLLQIDNMDIVHKAIDIDNRETGLLPGIDYPTKGEHKLIFKDEAKPGDTMVEPSDPGSTGGDELQKEKKDPETGEYEF